MFIKDCFLADDVRCIALLLDEIRLFVYLFLANLLMLLVTQEVIYCPIFELYIAFGVSVKTSR